MNREESFYTFKRWCDRQDELDRIGKDFHSKLTDELLNYILRSRPALNSCHMRMKETLHQLSLTYTWRIFECFNAVHFDAWEKTGGKNILEVPKPNAWEDLEKELQQKSKTQPYFDYDYMSAIYRKRFIREQEIEKFQRGAWQLMKQIITEFYADDMMEWEGKYLKELDGSLYHFCASSFARAYFEWENNIIEKDQGNSVKLR